ncbi:MAG: DUF484 family protein [Desulfomonile tiedjei]|nr:DUF484 family protein [Desulfomonile tiedjei]
MQGFPTIGSSVNDELHGTATAAPGSRRSDHQRCTPHGAETPAGQDTDSLEVATCPESEPQDTNLFDDDENAQLIRSFDMIFRLHQRSEEIRSHLERIDLVLLNSRSVEQLVENTIAALEAELDLVAVRFLLKEDHPVASVFRRNASRATGIISEDFLSDEGLFRSDPFILDDPAGDLAHRLFGDSASLIASAAVAPLCHGEDELGLLCLGSDDPFRYCGGMNTDLIASMATKISLGILNAWDHQNSSLRAFKTRVEGVHTELFFEEYLEKEFNRAWRYRTTFCLLAVSWKSAYEGAVTCPDLEVVELLQGHLRSSDLAAQGEAVKLWVLLPDSNSVNAEVVAERLTDISTRYFDGEISLYIGITEFARSVPTFSMLLQQARSALDEALGHDSGNTVINIPSPPGSPATDPAEHELQQSAANQP